MTVDPEQPKDYGPPFHSSPLDVRDDEGRFPLSKDDLTRLFSASQRVSAPLSSAGDLTELVAVLLSEAADLVRATDAALLVPDPTEPGLLRLRDGLGLLARQEGALVPVSGSFEGSALDTRYSRRDEDLTARRLPHDWYPGAQLGPAIAVALPGDGGADTVLLLARRPGEAPFGQRDARLIESLATIAGPAWSAGRAVQHARRYRDRIEAWNRERELASENARASYALVQALRHEINNPLAVILGHAQLLRTEKSLEGDQNVMHSVIAIVEQGERIAELVKRLSAVGRSTERLRVNPAGGIDILGKDPA